MSTSLAALLGVVLGVVLGTVLGLRLAPAMRVRRRRLADDRSDVHRPLPAAGATSAPDLADLPRVLLERVPIGVVVLDASDGVALCNAAARRLRLVTGLTSGPGALTRARALDPLVTVARAARRDGETADDLTVTGGGWPPRPVDTRVRAVPLPSGRVALLVEDVTEARRVEAVRRDFVANVGHEIKTPVGALALLAEAALEAGDDVAEVQRFVGRIRHEAARLSRLVVDLLDLSRLQGAEARPDLVPVALDAVIAEAVDRCRMAADTKRSTVVVGGEQGAVVAGKEEQLVTALANLIDNAIAYSPEATRVAVGVRRRDDQYEVTVTDQGIGIPAEDLDRVFERFYRVDPARSRETGGTGLGLAIVKHVVQNHGGEVRVWSSPGAGSTFTLVLPVPAGGAASRLAS